MIAATHRDLTQKVADGSFREDLYYRLNVFPIYVPPLRERSDDIPVLTWAFVRQFEKKMKKKIDSLPSKTMEALQHYPWPGNVRELQNVVEHAVILSAHGEFNVRIPDSPRTISLPTLKQAEYHHIVGVLEKTGWRVKGPQGAASLLGMNPSTLFATMRRLGIPSKSEKV